MNNHAIEPDVEHLIEVRQVGKDYQSGESTVQAIKEMSLYIDDGEFVSIMGQSGSGKSTLLSILIFQSFQLIPYLTVLENVKLPMAITGKKAKIQDKMARDVLDRVGLANKADRLPDQLSGGEQERVAIARAIVNKPPILKPPILLADEPTGSLDSKTAEDIMNLLKELNREGQTIIMVTHNPEACKHSSRTIMVKDGSWFLLCTLKI
jgi:putative ABC transport system ATP-binding protein